MTLVVHRSDIPVGVHALVVGVGLYPYLAGSQLHGDLGGGLSSVLACAEPSAAAVAAWLLQQHDAPHGPLLSLELLLSGGPMWPPGDPAGTAVEAPLYDNVQEAFRRWMARADEHPDNLAFLYWVGHGLEGTDKYLLAQDAGADPEEILANVVNVDVTRRRLSRRCKARDQVFVLEACATEASFVEVTDGGMSGCSPLGEARHIQASPRLSAVLHAAGRGHQALAPAGGKVAYMTQAMLECLRGPAAGVCGGGREVAFQDLQRAVEERLREAGETDQQPSLSGNPVRSVAFHMLSAPVVPVRASGLRVGESLRISGADGTVMGIIHPGEELWVAVGEVTVHLMGTGPATLVEDVRIVAAPGVDVVIPRGGP